MIRLLMKAIRTVVDQGVTSTFRQAIWKMFHERYKRQKALLGMREQLPSVIRFLGNDFELYPSKEGVSETLLMYGSHEPVATSFYQKFLSSGDHVIDIGSNIGYFLLIASKQVGSTGRLLGLEPVPSLFEILKRNVDRIGQRNIEVFPWAVGAQCGIQKFYKSEIPNWGSLIRDDRLLQSGTIEVQVKSLDDIVRNSSGFYPRALRMDLEGGELMVLEGAREMLYKYKPLLFIEFHNFALGWDAIRKAIVSLRNVGYSSGVVIERMWDHPWISNWMRKRRWWSGDINTLLERIESPTDGLPLEAGTFTFFLRA